MKVKELIELLKKMPQDLIVYGYCDHGQSPEKVAVPCVAYTKDTTHILFDNWNSIKEEANEEGYTTKFVLL